MHAFLVISAGVAGVLLTAGLAMLPLRLGWPRQVRWLVAAHAVGYTAGPYAAPLDLREVSLTSVEPAAGQLELRVLEVGHPVGHMLVLRTDEPPAAPLAEMLQEWCVLGTPMLLFVDSGGLATLNGPVAAVSGLRRVELPAVDRPRAVS